LVCRFSQGDDQGRIGDFPGDVQVVDLEEVTSAAAATAPAMRMPRKIFNQFLICLLFKAKYCDTARRRSPGSLCGCL